MSNNYYSSYSSYAIRRQSENRMKTLQAPPQSLYSQSHHKSGGHSSSYGTFSPHKNHSKHAVNQIIDDWQRKISLSKERVERSRSKSKQSKHTASQNNFNNYNSISSIHSGGQTICNNFNTVQVSPRIVTQDNPYKRSPYKYRTTVTTIQNSPNKGGVIRSIQLSTQGNTMNNTR